MMNYIKDFKERCVVKTAEYLVDNSKIGCGVPPINITDPGFIFFPACEEHDWYYAYARRLYLDKEIDIAEAEHMVLDADDKFCYSTKELAKSRGKIKALVYWPIAVSFNSIVRTFGLYVWRQGTFEKEELIASLGV